MVVTKITEKMGSLHDKIIVCDVERKFEGIVVLLHWRQRITKLSKLLLEKNEAHIYPLVIDERQLLTFGRSAHFSLR